ncbi:hypothetical protein BH09MYX1_BH09MYX1_23660 [soil metagenome]
MNRRTKIVLATLAAFVSSVGVAAAIGRPPSTHAVTPSELGTSRSSSEMERVIDGPGPLTTETITAADWEVDREGLIDLDSDEAKRAKLAPGPEPIRIFLHAIRHPTRGLFLVDTGVEHALAVDPAKSAVGPWMSKVLPLGKLHVRTETATFLATQPDAPAGVLFTHLHMDHVMGTPDIPNSVPLYAGPGETSGRTAAGFAVAPMTDAELAGKGPLHEWAFAADPDGRFAGVLDVFGDGSLLAISVPGHTPGSTAYLARTTKGPVLYVGDACHTRWGWEHHVAPGTYSADRSRGAESLQALEDLVTRHPTIEVKLGHEE